MSTRGIYGYEKDDGSIDAVFLRWASPDDSSKTLSEYGNRASAASLVSLGMTENFHTREIVSPAFFEGERFAVPVFYTIEEDGMDQASIFYYENSRYDEVAEEIIKGMTDIGRSKRIALIPTTPASYILDSSSQENDISLPYHTYQNIVELEFGADDDFDFPEFAYIHEKMENAWICVPLIEDGEYFTPAADAWNELHIADFSDTDLSKHISSFHQEIENTRNNFAEAFNSFVQTADEMCPGMAEASKLNEVFV